MNKPIKGENLMIFVKEGDLYGNASTALIPFAHATTCSLNIDVEAFDITSKDTGSWKASLPGMKSWSLSSDCLYTPDADKLAAVMLNRIPLKCYWCPSENTEFQNQVSHDPSLNQGDDSYMYYAGDAWINSFQATANNNEAANYTVNLTGTGPLTPSNQLPSVGIGVDRPMLTIAPGDNANVNVSNASGPLTATCSYTGVTTTITNNVVKINVAGSAAEGATHVLISDGNSQCYVSVIIAD